MDIRTPEEAEVIDARTLQAMKNPDDAINFIRERWGDPELHFAEDVHDFKAEEAARINNEGLFAQLFYLTGGDTHLFGAVAADLLYGK